VCFAITHGVLDVPRMRFLFQLLASSYHGKHYGPDHYDLVLAAMHALRATQYEVTELYCEEWSIVNDIDENEVAQLERIAAFSV